MYFDQSFAVAAMLVARFPQGSYTPGTVQDARTPIEMSMENLLQRTCERLNSLEARLTEQMADDVLEGFALDASGWRPRSEEDLLRYCYHAAGAPALMMARIMGIPDDDEATLDRVFDFAVALQLADIAREVWTDDTDERCYLPVEWSVAADIPPGEHLKPIYRDKLVALVARLLDMAARHEAAGQGSEA